MSENLKEDKALFKLSIYFFWWKIATTKKFKIFLKICFF